MTTITAHPDTRSASVLLAVEKTSTVTKIYRSDANGIAEVRGTIGAFPSPYVAGSNETMTIIDYEAAHGPVTYTVQDGGSGAMVGTYLQLDAPWLFVPILPNFSMQVGQISNYTSNRSTGSTVHKVIGRPDPLVTLSRHGMRTGTLDMWCKSYQAARDLENVIDRGEVAMLRQRVQGLDMYFIASNTTIRPYSAEGELDTRYSLTIDFTEVRRPFGNLQGGIGWSFDDLATQYPTFALVASSFRDFDALTLGEEL